MGILLVAGGAAALATVPVGNNFPVAKCTPLNDGVFINRTLNTPGYKLPNGCRDAGHGLRQYTMTCVGSTKYRTEWVQPCPSIVLPDLSFFTNAANNTKGINWLAQVQGKQVNVSFLNSVSLSNLSSAPVIKIYWLKDDQNTIISQEEKLSILDPRSTQGFGWVNFAFNTNPEVRFVKAVLDSKNLISESNENNNSLIEEVPANWLTSSSTVAVSSVKVNIIKASDSPAGTTIPGIQKVVASFVVFNSSTIPEDVNFSSFSLMSTGTFSPTNWKLYEGSLSRFILATGKSSDGKISFNGFSSTIPPASSKTYYILADTLDAKINGFLSLAFKNNQDLSAQGDFSADTAQVIGAPLTFGPLAY